MTNEEAIEILNQFKKCLADAVFDEKGSEAWQMAIKALSQEQKSGKWIMSDDGLYRPICDKCGAHPWKGYIPTVEEATEVFKYCPNCGAKMESEDKE